VNKGDVIKEGSGKQTLAGPGPREMYNPANSHYKNLDAPHICPRCRCDRAWPEQSEGPVRLGWGKVIIRSHTCPACGYAYTTEEGVE
jgi:rubredoxin